MIGFKKLIFLATLCLTSLASAQSNRAALIIGIGNYQNATLAPPLFGVPTDIESAKSIAKAMGIPHKNVTVIIDQQATKKNLMNAFKKISEFGANGGRVFIYFSGHGSRDYDPQKKQCYEGLHTYDHELITNEEIAVATQKLKDNVDKTIVLFDACHAGGVLKTALQTRSAGGGSTSTLTPKFVIKGSLDDVMACRAATNFQTRGLFDQSTRLGALQENLVFISSAKQDEVAWDEGPGYGGIATQALRDCLLGQARDTNLSGAVSLEEVRACAQGKMDKKLPGPNPKTSTLTIRGNRNLIPVASTSTPPVTTDTPSKPPVEAAPAKPPPVASNPAKPPAPPPAAVVPTPTPAVDLPLASLATLKDIEAQRNPTRKIDIKLAKKTLKINQDYLDLQIKSSHDGYLYMVLLGSDKKSFYMLYPNKLDENNRIQAGKTINLPNQTWQIKAAGPAGIDHILVMVAESPRDLKLLEALGVDQNSPFVYALNNPKGRSAVINYLTGKDTEGASERFAAQIINVTEVP